MGDRLDPTRRVVPTLIAQYYIPYRNNISLQGVSFIPILLWSLIYLTVTPLSTALAESREPIQLKADRLEYLKEEDLYLAEGSVGVRQGEIRIEADSLRLENTTGILRATGNVHFADGENLADADRAELDVNTKLGVLYNSSLFIKSDNYYLKGKRIERRALDRYELQDGSFTACECEKDPDWQIRARRLRVSLEKFLVARDIVFYANDLPIFYLPYLIYPVKTKRQTGLLVPRLGYSSRHGFRYRQDFFWAIAQNQDATFTFEHKGSKGDGLAIAYRYLLSRNSGGTIKTDYFLDRKDNLGRWEIRYDHQQRLADRIHVKLDARYVNQTNQFQDLSDQTSDRALQEVESNIFLTYRGEESFAYLLARYTQNLTTPNNSATIQRLPEIGYTLNEYRLGTAPLFLHFEGTAVNFWREVGVKVQRIDLYPKMAWPISLPHTGTLTPWAGFRETWYSRGKTEKDPISRESVPTGIKWEGLFHRKWRAATHLISPSIFYEYIAVEEDADIPQFDALDRIRDRNAITVSVMQRLLIADEGGRLEERGFLRLTETYDIDAERSDAPGPRPYSDLRGELELRPFSSFSMAFDAFYNLHDSRFTSWNSDLLLNLKPYLNFSVGQRYTRAGSIPQKGDLFNPLYLGEREGAASDIFFWTGAVIIKTPWGFGFGNKTHFDADAGEVVEVDYELFYEAQCWGIVLSYLEFSDRSEFFFSITLKGLGEMNSRVFGNLFTPST